MTKYSEWTIIPKDRTCTLPRQAKVQVMWRNEDAEHSEKYNNVNEVSNCTASGLWLQGLFAYRVVQEPVEKVREYQCSAVFYGTATPAFYSRPHNKIQGITKGTATETTRDGKPYEFHWRANE